MARRESTTNDVSDLWRAYRECQQARRAIRLPARQREILDLARDQFAVRQLTPYQFRIDNRLDLFPIHRRYHDVLHNRRGSYTSAKAIAIRILRRGRAATREFWKS